MIPSLTLLLFLLLLLLYQITVSYQSLDILQEHGIAANDIQKLNVAGYHTLESVRAHIVFVFVPYRTLRDYSSQRNHDSHVFFLFE
jgi:vancomycin permeability regulator SanA